MSTLNQLVSLPDTAAFPGHALSPPRLIEFAEAEEEAAAHYLRAIARTSLSLPPDLREMLHQRAVDNLKTHPFAFGTPAFDRWALSMSAGPFLTWLLLRIREPRLTLADAVQLLSEADFAAKISAVWAMWGYKPAKKESAPEPATGAAPPTGEPTVPSTGPGSSADLPPAIPAAAASPISRPPT